MRYAHFDRTGGLNAQPKFSHHVGHDSMTTIHALSRLVVLLLIPVLLILSGCTPDVVDNNHRITGEGILVEGFENADDWRVVKGKEALIDG